MRLTVGVLSFAIIGIVNARPSREFQSTFRREPRDASKSNSIRPSAVDSIETLVTYDDPSRTITIPIEALTARKLSSRSPQRQGPKIPSIDQLSTIAKGIIPKDANSRGDQVTCTNQEVSCTFLQKQAFDLQNDDDACLRIATSFDDQGKLDIQPLASSSDTVVYGITTDGLSASAWCNDIGWTLRRIYTKCRKGKLCYGGQGYAARNAAFMVSVGPKSGGPSVVARWPNINFYDVGNTKV